jgi:hypothetical protein
MIRRSSIIRHSLLVFFFLAGFSAVHAQLLRTKVTIEINNTSLENSINILNQKLDYIFTFKNEIFPKGKMISISVHDMPLEQVLDILFAGTNIKYLEFGKQIIIKTIAQDIPVQLSGIISELFFGEPLKGILIELYKASDKEQILPYKKAYSDKFGNFIIANLPAGEYHLAAKGQSYKTKILRINIKQDVKNRIEINLEKEKQEEELERTQTQGLSKINSNIILKNLSSYIEPEPECSFHLIPGITTNSEIVKGLYIRGGTPDQNLILLDGAQIFNPSHLGEFYSAFDPKILNEAKLIKGTFPAEYGCRISSVLDLTTREVKNSEICGNAGISLIGSQLYLESPISQKSGLLISGRRIHLDYFRSLMEKTNLYSDAGNIPLYNYYDAICKTYYHFSTTNTLSLCGYLSGDKMSSPEPDTDKYSIQWYNATGILSWKNAFSENFILKSSFNVTQYKFDAEMGNNNYSSYFSSGTGITSFILKSEMEYHFSKNNCLKTGFDIKTSKYICKLNSSYAPDTTSESYSVIGNADFGQFNTLEADLFLQNEFLLTEKISLNYGIRLNYINTGNYLNLEPRLSVAYYLTNEFIIKGAGALTCQSSHLITRNDIQLPAELWFSTTNYIKPSKSTHGTFGFDYSFNDETYLLSGEAFYNTTENLYEYKENIFFSNNLTLTDLITIGKSETYGYELFINKRIGDFTGWAGYTYSVSKRYFDKINNGEFFYPYYDRRHDIKVNIIYNTPDWETGINWVYATGQSVTMPAGQYSYSPTDGTVNQTSNFTGYYYSSRNSYRLPATHRADIYAGYKFLWNRFPCKISINILNAYNRLNVFSAYMDYKKSAGSNTIKPSIKKITLFPVIPSLEFNIKF